MEETIILNRLEKLKKMLSLDPERIEEAFCLSVYYGNHDCTNYCLSLQRDLPRRCPEAVSSAAFKSTSLLKTLLSLGGDHNAEDGKPLAYASALGKTDRIKILFEAGADVHAGDDRALRWAARNGRLEAAKLLLEHGADPKAAWFKAVTLSLSYGQLDILKLFLEDREVLHFLKTLPPDSSLRKRVSLDLLKS